MSEETIGLLMNRLERIETTLSLLVDRETPKEWYDIEEFAKLVGKAPFTCREWCRHGRIHCQKRQSGRGSFAAWVVSHLEVQRYRREGLLPVRDNS